MERPPLAVDRNSGFSDVTRTFYSLRRPLRLPPPSLPLSFTSYALSLLPNPLPEKPAVIDAVNGDSISFPELIFQIRSLAASLRSNLRISAGNVAFILSPSRLEIPALYLALLSIGATVSAANPLSTPAEMSHFFSLSSPSIVFATSSSAHKVPRNVTIVIIDSPEFKSLLTSPLKVVAGEEPRQSDTATVLYSSGTTGRAKGVAISHRNLIAVISGFNSMAEERREREIGGPDLSPRVWLFTIPTFHVFGFFMVLRLVSIAETMVLMQKFDFETMLRAVERFRVTSIPLSPPLVLALAKSDLVKKYDLSSLRNVGCGGAPLGKEAAKLFAARLPGVEVGQGYGLTESSGSATVTGTAEEIAMHGTVGRLSPDLEAKIVDPTTGEALGPGRRGELWLRGPVIMKGYVGDEAATATAIDSEGWLKTGDLCYFDDNGFLFIIDRLKELIKYKAYQVPPAELEHILNSHPKVADAAVIPYPDEEAGQIPMAVVVRKSGCAINEKQIMEFVAKQVAPYKKVRRVLFTDLIPKNPSGKILRRELLANLLPKNILSKI